MSAPKTTAARDLFGDIAPKFAELSDETLFGDIWERPQLSKRDRSLITCAVLVATGKPDQMQSHFPPAIAIGVTQGEIIEMITHVAFYAGWPSAVTAALRPKDIFANKS